MQLMNSIHQELKLIIEDELFDKIKCVMPSVGVFMNLIGKMDVTLSFSQYLRCMPNGIKMCRPTLMDEQDEFSPGVYIEDGRNPLFIHVK